MRGRRSWRGSYSDSKQAGGEQRSYTGNVRHSRFPRPRRLPEVLVIGVPLGSDCRNHDSSRSVSDWLAVPEVRRGERSVDAVLLSMQAGRGMRGVWIGAILVTPFWIGVIVAARWAT